MFNKFLNSLKRPNNLFLIETIQKGYTVFTEANNLKELEEEAKKFDSAESFAKSKVNAYHKSSVQFDEFDFSKIGKHDYGYAGRGIYFTETPLKGNSYGKNTISAYVDFKKPYIRTNENWNISKLDPYKWIAETSKELQNNKGLDIRDANTKASNEWTEMMKAKGYDGFIDNTEGLDERVAFYPDSIKTSSQLIDIWNKANPSKSH